MPAPYEPPSHLAGRRRDFLRVLRADPCALCPLARVRIGGTIDHIEPRSKGGPDAIENLAGLCPACNEEKASRSLLLYLLYRVGAISDPDEVLGWPQIREA